MNKKNLPAIAGVVAAILIVVICVVWLANGLAAQAKTRTELKIQQHRRMKLFQADPFPSKENIKAEQQNLATTEVWRASLRDAIKGVPPNVKVNTAIGLQEEVEKVLEGLRKEAGDRVPPGFKFGLDYYADNLADPAHVTRVDEQLLLIDTVCRAVLSSGIERLSIVDRERFDNTKSTAPGAQTESSGGGSYYSSAGNRSYGNEEETVVDKSDASDISPGLQKERFTLVFSSSQDAVFNVLNRLATHERFIRVTSVKVAKGDPDVYPPKALAPGSEDETTEQLTQMERIVSGPGLPATLTVTMVIDVFWLEPTQEQPETSPVS